MKAKSLRELMAQAAIVLAVCVGAWLMFVKPKVDELARLDQQMSEQTAAPSATINQHTVEDAARKISAVKERVRDIQSFNALAGDSSRFYGTVMDLADAHGVQVHNLQPGSIKQTESEGKITITRITLGAEGEYARMASFLDAVCTVDAFVRPVALQLDPSRDMTQASVQATLTCDVLSFTLDGALQELLASGPAASPIVAAPAALGESSHGQP
jgi:hypothetical protein